MRAVGYARRTRSRRNGALSLDAQEERIRAWAAYRQVDLTEVVREDGTSGELPAADRPGLSRVMRALEEGKANAVVFAKLDRLARNVHEFSGMMRLFRSRQDWDMVCLSPEFDTGTAAGRLVAHVFASIGEWEVDNTVERLQDARNAKAEQGLYVGGHTVPFGWRVGEDGRFVPDPEQQETVRRIIALRDGEPRRTWKQVSEAIDRTLTPNGCKKVYRRETGESGGRVHRAAA